MAFNHQEHQGKPKGHKGTFETALTFPLPSKPIHASFSYLHKMRQIQKAVPFLFSFLFLVGLFSCSNYEKKKLEVTATAYNSLANQTDDDPTVAAWGDTLEPGMKVIAVSRDLLDSGLTHNTKVWIEDVPGTYYVKDKMNRRWTKKIDIYMGAIEKDAREWGKRTVTIHWKVPKEKKAK
jgi:3D (Asp-Asp-Asp) domain-containing protein